MVVRSLLLFAYLAPLAAAQCFNLDGSQVTEPDFVPCNNGGAAGAASMCCALSQQQQEAGVGAADVCMPNGLCQSTATDSQGRQRAIFSRDSCSRPDWAGCLKSVCPGVTEGNVTMTPCGASESATEWCCGDNNADCCAAWPNHPDAVSVPVRLNAAVPAAAAAAPAPGVTSTGLPRFTPFTETTTSLPTFTRFSPGPAESTVLPPPVVTAFSGGGGSLGAAPTVVETTDAFGNVMTVLSATATDGSPAGTGTAGFDTGDASPSNDLNGGFGGLSTQAIAGIVAGVVLALVILITIGCFMAESCYKKKHAAYKENRRGSLKNKIRFGRRQPELSSYI